MPHRRFLTVLVLIAMFVSMSACGDGGTTTADAATPRDAPSSSIDAPDETVDAARSDDASATGDDAPTADLDATSIGADSATSSGDAPSTTGACLFAGRYRATNIRCNGEAYERAALLTPPAGGWYVEDDGTHASFTQTVGTCSLVATGTIACDSPVAGQFSHRPDAPLRCDPAGCMPFASLCSGSSTGTEAVWTYTRNPDGSIEAATVGDTPIRTCTSGGQDNPVQITWVPAP